MIKRYLYGVAKLAIVIGFVAFSQNAAKANIFCTAIDDSGGSKAIVTWKGAEFGTYGQQYNINANNGVGNFSYDNFNATNTPGGYPPITCF